MAFQTNITELRPLKSSALLHTPLTFILYAIIFLPFFEPGFLGHTEVFSQAPILSTIGELFNVLQVVVSVFALLVSINKVNFRKDALLLAAFLLTVIAVAVSSGYGLALREFLKVLSYVGLLVTFRILYKHSKHKTLLALCFLFALYGLMDMISVFILPRGLFQIASGTATVVTPYDLIYFFGGKNSIFLSGVLLIASVAAKSIILERRIGYAPAVLSVLYAVASYRVDSASSLVCFTLIAVLLLIAKKTECASKLLDPKLYFIVIAIVFFSTVVFGVQTLFPDIFGFLNRTSTFSGRPQVWAEAMNYIAQKPFLGSGKNLVYTLGYELINHTDHPHSFYLQYTAAYGCLFMGFFLADIILIIKRSSHRYARSFSLVIAIPFFALLFHSMYDLMTMANYLLLRELLLTAQMSDLEYCGVEEPDMTCKRHPGKNELESLAHGNSACP